MKGCCTIKRNQSDCCYLLLYLFCGFLFATSIANADCVDFGILEFEIREFGHINAFATAALLYNQMKRNETKPKIKQQSRIRVKFRFQSIFGTQIQIEQHILWQHDPILLLIHLEFVVLDQRTNHSC